MLRRHAILCCLGLLLVGCESDIMYHRRDPESGNWNVYKLECGTEELLLANTGGASWSPDGKRIAFFKKFADKWHLWVTAEDEGPPLNLTAAVPQSIRSYDWSPDSRQVVFSAGVAGLYVVDTDGLTPPRILPTLGTASYPEWSPDGSRIAFVLSTTASADSRIMTMAADGTDQTLLSTPGDASPSWSPDGRFVAFRNLTGSDVSDWELTLRVVDAADGASRRVLTSRPWIAVRRFAVGNVHWSPDSRYAAYTAWWMRIYLYRIDGWSFTRLPFPPGEDAPFTNDMLGVDPFSPPDGRLLLFARSSSSDTEGELMTWDREAEPGDYTSLGVRGAYPSWRPAGYSLCLPL